MPCLSKTCSAMIEGFNIAITRDTSCNTDTASGFRTRENSNEPLK